MRFGYRLLLIMCMAAVSVAAALCAAFLGALVMGVI